MTFSQEEWSATSNVFDASDRLTSSVFEDFLADGNLDNRGRDARLFLETSIGPTGLLAIKPFLRMSRKDLWQLYQIER